MQPFEIQVGKALPDQTQNRDTCATGKKGEGPCETAVKRHSAENTHKVK